MAAAPTTSQASWSLSVELDYRAQLLQLAKHSSPAQPLWLVAPPELLAWHHQTLARQVPGASVELLSWDRLRETLEELLLLPNLKVTSPQELQVAIAHTLEALIAQGQVPPELGSAYDQDPLGVSAALLPPVRSYSEWVEPATSQTAPHPLSERHLVLLQKLHQGVEATLNGQKLATPPMAWSRILENLDQLPAFACPATIALDGFDRLDIHQLALLRALLDRKVGVLAPSWLDIDHPRVSIGVAVPPLSVCHFTVRDPLDEADAALEWVRSRLQTGAGLLDLAVTVPPGEGYEGCLEKVLSTAGVPVAFTQRVPLGQTKEPFPGSPQTQS